MKNGFVLVLNKEERYQGYHCGTCYNPVEVYKKENDYQIKLSDEVVYIETQTISNVDYDQVETIYEKIRNGNFFGSFLYNDNQSLKFYDLNNDRLIDVGIDFWSKLHQLLVNKFVL